MNERASRSDEHLEEPAKTNQIGSDICKQLDELARLVAHAPPPTAPLFPPLDLPANIFPGQCHRSEK